MRLQVSRRQRQHPAPQVDRDRRGVPKPPRQHLHRLEVLGLQPIGRLQQGGGGVAVDALGQADGGQMGVEVVGLHRQGLAPGVQGGEIVASGLQALRQPAAQLQRAGLTVGQHAHVRDRLGEPALLVQQ